MSILSLRRIWLFISFYICSTSSATSASEPINEKPSLTLQNDWPEADWKFVNLSDGSQGLFSQVKSTLIMNCSASYPVQWRIQGTIEPPEFVKIQPYRRITIAKDNSELFHLQIIIFFTPMEKCFSSATIICEKIGAPEIASQYAVFVPSDNNTFISKDKNSEIYNSIFKIPCPTTDPTMTVSLHHVTEQNELVKVEDKNMTYIETEGFQSFKPFKGTFVCFAKHDNRNEAQVTYTTPKYPVTREVKGFVGEDLKIYCSTPNYTITTNDNTVADQIKVVQVHSTGYKIMIPAKAPVKGVLKCGTFGNENVIEIWNFEVLGFAPQLYLDNYEGEVDCLSEYPDRSVSTVRCRDPSDCDYMKHCFDTPGSCNYRRQKQFHSQYPGRCWLQSELKGANCATMPYYHLNGIVQCGGGGSAMKRFMFFVGLDMHRYSDWHEAPTNALIRIGYEKFENRTQFLCEAAAFLFADSLKFSILYENGTEEFLESPESNNPSSFTHPKRMDELNVLVELIKTDPFPTEVVALKCHAPWWNSTQFMTSQIKLKMVKVKDVGDNCL